MKSTKSVSSSSSSGPSCGCLLMIVGLGVSAAFGIFCIVVVNSSPDSKPETLVSEVPVSETSAPKTSPPVTSGGYDPSRRLNEIKSMIHRSAEDLAFPDSQKGLEIVKGALFNAAALRSKMEAHGNYLRDLYMKAKTQNFGISPSQSVEVPKFPVEHAMISYCLDLCAAAENLNSVAQSRADVRGMAETLGYSRRHLGMRVGKPHPARDFPSEKMADLLRQLESCHEMINKQVSVHAELAVRPSDEFPWIDTLRGFERIDEDLQRIRYCRHILRAAQPKEFEAADRMEARMREANEEREAAKSYQDALHEMQDAFNKKGQP